MRDFKFFYSQLILIWSVVSCLSLVLQAIKIFGTKQAAGVSLASYCVTIVGALCWLGYAIFVLSPRSVPIIINSTLSIILAIIIVVGICIYGGI